MNELLIAQLSLLQFVFLLRMSRGRHSISFFSRTFCPIINILVLTLFLLSSLSLQKKKKLEGMKTIGGVKCGRRANRTTI